MIKQAVAKQEWMGFPRKSWEPRTLFWGIYLQECLHFIHI